MDTQHTKINAHVKTAIYDWIIQHTQVVQQPIENDCLKVSIGGHYETQLVPNFLSQVYARIDGNYRVITLLKTVVMEIYHYAERIWIILVTPNF